MAGGLYNAAGRGSAPQPPRARRPAGAAPPGRTAPQPLSRSTPLGLRLSGFLPRRCECGEGEEDLRRQGAIHHAPTAEKTLTSGSEVTTQAMSGTVVTSVYCGQRVGQIIRKPGPQDPCAAAR